MSLKLEDPVLLAFAGGAMLLSTSAVLTLAVAKTRGPLVKFQPRQLVPWNAAGAALACLMVALILATALQHAPPVVETAETVKVAESTAPDFAVNLALWVVQELFLVGGFVFLIAVYFKANCVDLGLPTTWNEFVQDALTGTIAGVAALAPVLLIQTQLIRLFDLPETESGNPLIKTLMGGGPNVGVMLLATFATIVVAPVCEEITFRLLLQGWLEKWEANTLKLDIPHSTLKSPPSRGLAGLPFSWLPITISSLLFGLAHFGYGPEPVPLFFLALVLGYLYYRTHRIVPSIVAHAVFNAFTMAMLWRMAFHSAP